jgi:hypothetical protein
MVMISPQIATTNSAPGKQPYFAHRNDVIGRRALGVGIGRKAVLRLGDTDREFAVAYRLEMRELVALDLSAEISMVR